MDVSTRLSAADTAITKTQRTQKPRSTAAAPSNTCIRTPKSPLPRCGALKCAIVHGYLSIYSGSKAYPEIQYRLIRIYKFFLTSDKTVNFEVTLASNMEGPSRAWGRSAWLGVKEPRSGKPAGQGEYERIGPRSGKPRPGCRRSGKCRCRMYGGTHGAGADWQLQHPAVRPLQGSIRPIQRFVRWTAPSSCQSVASGARVGT